MRVFVRPDSTGDACKNIKYLWIHVNSQERESIDTKMTLDDWFNVVDETASLGARSLIVTAKDCLCKYPEVWDICRWAQTQHEMHVGIHISQGCFNDSELRQLGTLVPEKTRIFIDGGVGPEMDAVKALGVDVLSADGLEDGAMQPHCELPHTMSCIDLDGEMYTCGLVLRNDEFRFGHASEKRMDHVIADQTLPHCVPENTSSAPGRCNGCPPLLEMKLRGESHHH